MAKKYIDADLLRKEIEKLKKEYDARVSSTLISEGLVYMGKVEAINKALCIIDSLRQNQQEVDLEEAAEEYMQGEIDTGSDYLSEMDESLYYAEALKDAFIAGAKWQAEKDKETIELAEDHAYFAGAVNEREQMLKEAVEKTVGQLERQWGGNIHFMHGFEVDEMDFPFLNSQECGYGDKVCIIVLPKKDEK